ncbi:hypothetical protein niasHT_039802 [Heterodera trifolii]|uniref:Uncharacterized protein n=1 Tax=Heterodera trifolii TaxID=157864 RepID=A0ABD2IUN7_9BILA
MNHCIPDRKLQPDGALIHNGVIITSPLQGNIVHFVFRDKDSPLFAMPRGLFVCKNPYGMKNAQIIRHEKTLEFGDTIIFTAEERTNTVLDYEKGLQVFETDCNYGKYLVKSVCILPPANKDPLRCWCDYFGWIDLNTKQSEELHMRAMADVPIYTWVAIEIHGDRVVPKYHDFIEIAVDERKNVWDVEWNLHNENRPKGNSYKWEITDDEDDEEPDFIEKSEDQLLDVKLKLEGCLIGTRELYCNELKEHRVFVGLWQKHQCKADNVPLGQRCNFDAYFNDIHGIYIAYFCEFGEDEDEDWLCDVFLPEFDNEPTVIGVTIYPSETWGALYKTSFFGLVADPNRLLGTLPYMFFNEELRKEEEEAAAAAAETDFEEGAEETEEYTGEILIYIVDTGPGKHKLCRFKLNESQPTETLRLVEKANNLAVAETLTADGFIYNTFNKFVYVPKYPTQLFIFPAEHIRNFPVGYWFKFEAHFNAKSVTHEIIGGQLDEQREIVPHSRIDEQNVSGTTIQRYEFKIEVELCSEVFAKDQLFNAMYGFISDVEGKFQTKKRTKKYKVIVGEDRTADGGTHFKFLRIAGNEQMMFERKPRNADIPYNDDTVATDAEATDDMFEDIGLDLANAVEEDKPLTQVDYLQEYSIRERKLKARERKRERDKKEKQMLEALRLQEETRATAAGAATGDAATTSHSLRV